MTDPCFGDPHQRISRLTFRWSRRPFLNRTGETLIVPKEGPQPVVTISRQRGCRGVELACILANELDYTVVDRPLLDYAARYMAERCELVESLDAAQRVEWEKALAARAMPADPNSYFYGLCEATLAMIAHGGVVIVGGGAHRLLGPLPGVRVRLVASMDFRVRNLVELEEHSEESARAEIEREDQRRRDFLRQFFGGDVEDPTGYDLVLNMDKMHIDTAVKTIQTALQSQGWAGRSNRLEKRRKAASKSTASK